MLIAFPLLLGGAQVTTAPKVFGRVFIGANDANLARYEEDPGTWEPEPRPKDPYFRVLRDNYLYLVDRDLVEDATYQAMNRLIEGLVAGRLPAQIPLTDLPASEKKDWAQVIRSGGIANGKRDNLAKKLTDPGTRIAYSFHLSVDGVDGHGGAIPLGDTMDLPAGGHKSSTQKRALPEFAPQKIAMRFPPGSSSAYERLAPKALEIVRELRSERTKRLQDRINEEGKRRLAKMLADPKGVNDSPKTFDDLDPAIRDIVERSSPVPIRSDEAIRSYRFVFSIGFVNGTSGSLSSVLLSYP